MKRLKGSPVLAGLVACFLSSCGTESAQRPEGAAPEAAAPANVAPPPEAAAPAEAEPQPAQAAPAAHGAKSAAPVEIAATLAERTAALDIAFRVDATEVTVKAWGLDGLEVQGNATPVVARAVAKGERVQVQLTFAAPPTPSTLAVSVSGLFGGRRQSKVRSFSVGGAASAAPAPAPAEGEVRKDPSGQPVRVMRPR